MNDRAAFFDATADGYDGNPFHEGVVRDLIEGLATSGPVGLAVDAATGTGAAAVVMVDAVRPSQVLAVDISPAMIRKAQAKAAERGVAKLVTCQVGDAASLPVCDGAADLILCASALHFLGAAALRDWHRALRPGGEVAFSVPMQSDLRPSPAFRKYVTTDIELPDGVDDATQLAVQFGFREARASFTEIMVDGRLRRTLVVHARKP
ncbi:class I SAM-dependent methyltransferase [Pseudonocardia pini]|uniref:class I SAM-dependent methyltransferase n=1 Tax=Pseudonocardia pini TaxID=2758030 RepID=UPI0015F0C55E|nr:class I SAM-dependent methyltransferase [Pseudonocardia pini]